MTRVPMVAPPLMVATALPIVILHQPSPVKLLAKIQKKYCVIDFTLVYICLHNNYIARIPLSLLT